MFAVRLLREELQLLQEPGSYVGEVVKVMGKTKVLCKVHPEGKYVVDLDKASWPLERGMQSFSGTAPELLDDADCSRQGPYWICTPLHSDAQLV